MKDFCVSIVSAADVTVTKHEDSFRFLWPCIVSKLWRERKKTNKMQQSDVYYQRCLNMYRASLCPSSGEQRPCVTACGMLRCFCWMWLVAIVGRCVVGCEVSKVVRLQPSQCSHPTTQRPATATNHIQQNQRSTPHAVTYGLFSPEDGHNDARNMLGQCW